MRVLVGITGGIAAYKAAEVIRELVSLGHDVRVVPTQNALRFVGAATLEALSHNPVHSDLYSDVSDVRHIELAKWAELILIAPATAAFLARTAFGLSEDLLDNVILASRAKLFIAPAMHTDMWLNASTVSNVGVLRSRGIVVLEPASGRLTGSDSGVGRLPEPKEIVRSALSALLEQDMSGKRVLIVAGGTRENIDPVRFIGNRSSGKQGIALVEEAIARGAKVKLVAANFDYVSQGVEVVRVSSTQELQDELERSFDFDIIVMPAAVADYSPEFESFSKLKKDGDLVLRLTQNPDLIASLATKARRNNASSKVAGFAAETVAGEQLAELARSKLVGKGLDLIVANDVSGGRGFDADTNEVQLVTRLDVSHVSGTKREIAAHIFKALLV